MSLRERATVVVSPWTAVLLAVFITLDSPAVLGVMLFAALCHELGHYLALRQMGGAVDSLRVTAFGAEMILSPRCRLSYGQELLAVAAGPAVNLLLSISLAALGTSWEMAYLAAGSHLVLGLFNLLPIRPLDGGQLLWLAAAWWTDPFLADRILRVTGRVITAVLLLAAGFVWYRSGSLFLFFAILGLVTSGWKEKRLVKKGKSR